MRRHEVLRTRVVVREGEPVQEITAAQGLALAVVDLRALPEEEREARARQLTEEEAGRPFDLGQGPLLRTVVLQLGREQQVLILNLHHIIADGWSLEVLWRELGRLYEGYEEGKGSPLEELPIQYADYGEWQREWLQGGVLEEQLSYWKKQLQGLPGMLELPTDRPRPALQSFRGAKQTTVLPGELAEGLKGLSRRAGTTLFMTLLAAFQVLLARASGQVDFAVGVPIANRNRVELEGLIGFFVNTLVMRSELSGEPSFRELLQRVREAALSGYAHQDLPFEKLVEEMQPERNLSHLPLFQVMFDVQNSPMPAWDFGGLRITQMEIETRATKCDLVVSIAEEEQGLVSVIEYNTDLFDAATIVGLQERYRKLLEEVVADEERCIWELPILSAGEQQQLAEWNQTQGEYPRQSIAELFEEQVERTPGGVAVVFEGEELSYGELNGRANQLAHYLRGLGVGREVLVGICVERSLEMVVGLLGILKAGGAYVPLDPSYPPERLRYMVEDAQVQVILTQQDWQRKLPATSVPVVCLDRDWGVIGQERKEDANSAVTAENLAYVAYTSGSTGAPKGVSILQKSVVRLVKGTDYVELSAGETFLQLAPISFDASTFEIWGCLLNGGRLVVMAPATPSLEEIGRALQQYQVTTLWLTAGLFHLMVNERVQDLRGVRQLLAGGDVLGLRQVQKVLQELPETRLINGYGPTEGTTFTCCYAMQGSGPGGSSVPIGRPIANTQVHILDATLQPVGIGVAGELYIGGDGLARGYWRRPELTAENFVPNPFSAEPGTRLYRSGDRARWLGDGNLEFYGRVDYQAKIRGYRVELEEIESVLQEQAGVQQAVVVVRAEGGGEKRLVGYVVAEPAAASASQLRTYLRSKLPEYMVPSAWVFLQQFPLTPNGKVDRSVLPRPESAKPRLAPPEVEHHTELEQTLAAVWQEVLQVDSVDLDDNLFDLGAHSLLVVRMASALRRVLNRDIPVVDLFAYPSIRALAQRLGQSAGNPVQLDDIEDRAGRRKQYLIHRKETMGHRTIQKEILG